MNQSSYEGIERKDGSNKLYSLTRCTLDSEGDLLVDGKVTSVVIWDEVSMSFTSVL